MPFDGRILAGVSVLAAIAEGGSFSQAAEVLGRSPWGVSRAVARLEARIGIRLVKRTTRSVRLTDEGAKFYSQVAPLLEGIEEATTAASGSAHSVRGRLRVSVDPFFSHLVLAPRLGDFVARYPNLSIDVIN
jgi:DNA-binding transcriptional LysR family regulator